MIQYKDYKHGIAVQIRFSDIDVLNHVNNACYHNYVELGRVKYFEAVIGGTVNWDVEGFMLARTEIDHIEQVYFGDEIYCFTKLHRIGNKSVRMRNVIVKKANDELIECAAVEAVLVAMDYKKNISIPVPLAWRNKFGAFEGTTF